MHYDFRFCCAVCTIQPFLTAKSSPIPRCRCFYYIISCVLPGRANKFLDAIIVVLHQTCDDNNNSNSLHQQQASWFESTTSLQQVSLDLCLACRDVITFHVRVTNSTPPTLWAPTTPTAAREKQKGSPQTSSSRKILENHNPVIPLEGRSPETDGSTPAETTTCSSEISEKTRLVFPRMRQKDSSIFPRGARRSEKRGPALYPETRRSTEMKHDFTRTANGGLNRVPAVRAKRVTWEKSPAALAQSMLPDAEKLEFGDTVRDDGSLDGVVWPRNLKRLVCGRLFDRSLSVVVWPPLLEELTTGRCFDQAIIGNGNIQWPRALRKLTFGFCFDQAIGAVEWPESLQQLEFGHCFNQPVQTVHWPQCLRKLTFGCNFDQEIDSTLWPDSLEELHFGARFNQRIARVKWPDSLRILDFSEDFNHSVENVVWPKSLQDLRFGHDFDKPIEDTKFPASLLRLEFGYRFNQAIGGVKWPPALWRLTFGCLFDQEIDRVAWPIDLRQVTFGGERFL